MIRHSPDTPLAYHITWTTYGTWLPGDERGWVDADRPGIQPPDVDRLEFVERALRYDPVTLTLEQREVVQQTIIDHCDIRGWKLHANNPRSNHVHVVVTADIEPNVARDQLKSWSARRLNAGFGKRPLWWTAKGSTKWIWDETYLQNAIRYVMEMQ